MCSINGFNFQDEGLIKRMNEITKHRGPDDSGVFLSSRWSLGHNRLSIIDLSSTGHQPMLSADKKFAIIFNGEIYNFLEIKKELEALGYKFKSKTDTEVILYAYQEWGSACLQKFNGMFALAILNTETEELFFARDRVGIKPLYYYHKDKKVIFSSEAKAILEHKIDAPLDYEALNIYFRLLYVPSPLTIWQNIYKLPPASYAVVNKTGDIKITKYWQFNDSSLLSDKEQIKEEISRLLHDSVKKQLMSDRPVGVFLSGGIDSTIITGIMSRLSDKVNTFSVGFEDTEEAAKYNNDFLIARRTAAHFNTSHHEYILSAQDVLANLPAAIYHMDEPISNHIQAVNLLLARQTTEIAKVVLGGDGGDELFGGYERYYYSALIDRFNRLPRVLRKSAAAKLFFSAAGKSGWYEKINTAPGVARYLSFFSQKERIISSFLSDEVSRPEVLPEFLSKQYFSEVDEADFTRQFMRTDIMSWLPDESLARSDKMSMAAGLEQRVPFLDHRLVELADRIPVRYKIGRKGAMFGSIGKHYEGKIILREAMREYLPYFVLSQPKWGWFSPAAKWLRGPLQPLMREALSPAFCAGTKDMFNFAALQKMLDDHISKKQYALNTLWSAMTFQLWYRQFMNK
ncbi:asparagine synthase (glutamine-hydrolyzing) [Candidatus Falkowbacteria bacterium RIFOXYA2_FULL_47_9]|uniref:asparagine synthase (glutamine-hydrolyzing) n=1 Tax=Candidatus Falkowbacteria bacterium RIFOXYA2_FULL_47_9 TaxID=1797995 RepID=A0A1F5SLN1_9BACT|nr:MAG: asparagine synthase (glutamine-hydrolyzing) [Candidatus Falkowbacteria bacterium RIFOXYA2_FULL_47_9]